MSSQADTFERSCEHWSDAEARLDVAGDGSHRSPPSEGAHPAVEVDQMRWIGCAGQDERDQSAE